MKLQTVTTLYQLLTSSQFTFNGSQRDTINNILHELQVEITKLQTESAMAKTPEEKVVDKEKK